MTIIKHIRITRILVVAIFSCFSHLTVNAQVRHVVLVSIDGFHPDMYLDKGWPTNNLRRIMQMGTYADHMKSVFPAYTYPAHTAMLTGALPARSKVVFNQPKNSDGEWNWYIKYVKTATIWQALHRHHLTTSAIMWPGTVGADIDYNMSEIWDVDHPDDRATVVRKYARPRGIYEEVERNATGKLDSANMNDNYLSLDENAGRMAAYVIQKYKPNFLAVHFATVDGEEHEFGRDADSVRLAVEANDRAIGDIMEAIGKSGIKDSTVVIVVGDHGFSTIHEIMRPNMLIRSLRARFIAAGGSAFLYHTRGSTAMDDQAIVKAVTDSLNLVPKNKRKQFRIIYRKELDQMGADSSAILALSAEPGLVFSSANQPQQSENHGPGTLIQNNKLEGLFIPTNGGHHGYDPNIPDMYTGFIAEGAGIIKGGHIKELTVTDLAPLIAKLLGIEFKTPDGKLPAGVLVTK